MTLHDPQPGERFCDANGDEYDIMLRWKSYVEWLHTHEDKWGDVRNLRTAEMSLWRNLAAELKLKAVTK